MIKVTFMMFCWLSIVCLIATSLTSAQVAYSRVLPYDPRYLLRRVPVRRSVEVEPRVRLPISRYFPQVDDEVVQVPAYIAQEPAAYRLSNGELYAIPAKWQEEAIPISHYERNDDNDYDNYEYDSELTPPVYAGSYPNEVYGNPPLQESDIQEPDADLYNDLMVNYLFNEMQPRQEQQDEDYMTIQRRSQAQQDQSSQQKKQESNETDASTVKPTAASQESSTSTPTTTSKVSDPIPVPEPTPKKTTVAVPQAFPFYNRLPIQRGDWHDFAQDGGQKEIPLYRPIHVGQPKSPMLSLEEQLARAKNSLPNKNAFPLLEKILASQRNKDPLTEQLDSLKMRSM